jgi:hypothetical protein
MRPSRAIDRRRPAGKPLQPSWRGVGRTISGGWQNALEPRTRVGNELALRQTVSPDGHRAFSIVKTPSGFFRFVEETEVYEPETPAVPGYWYWTETHRSGIYESSDIAENEAIGTLPWLKAQITN